MTKRYNKMTVRFKCVENIIAISDSVSDWLHTHLWKYYLTTCVVDLKSPVGRTMSLVLNVFPFLTQGSGISCRPLKPGMPFHLHFLVLLAHLAACNAFCKFMINNLTSTLTLKLRLPKPCHISSRNRPTQETKLSWQKMDSFTCFYY